MKIEVYTDGSATTADKPGGYGFVIVIDGVKHSEGSGHMPLATNNDAEMEAAIQGLAAVCKLPFTAEQFASPNVTVCSDSQLILGWISGRYRFKQASKIDRYNILKKLVNRLQVKGRWVKGHAGDEHNERCDRLANMARRKEEEVLDKKVKKDTGESLIGNKKGGTICVWYKDKLKVIDLENNTVEDYRREVHGNRGSFLEVRQENKR